MGCLFKDHETTQLKAETSKNKQTKKTDNHYSVVLSLFTFTSNKLGKHQYTPTAG